MFAATPLATGPFGALPSSHRRYNDAAGVTRLALYAAGIGAAYASGSGLATAVARAEAVGSRIVLASGVAFWRVAARSSATSLLGAVGVAGMRTSAAAWAAQINFPSQPPAQGRLTKIGRRIYRWEQTIGKWRPAGPA